MANVVMMPQIGLNETSNLISTWNKNVGEVVKVGDVLFTIETDKSSMEVESEFEGVLLKRLYEEGDACDVLTPVCIIGQEGEAVDDLSSAKEEEEVKPVVEATKETPLLPEDSQAKVVIMPQIGLNETSNLISTWNKNVGDAVKVGDVLFTIETDKSSMEVESEFEGIVLKKFYEEGDACDVLTPVCIIGPEGEDISGFSVNQSEVDEVQDTKIESALNNIQTMPAQGTINPDGIQKVSPRARNLAESKGADLGYAVGTGPEGRIIERDVYTLLHNGPVMTKAAKLGLGQVDPSSIHATGIGGRILSTDGAKTSTNETIVAQPQATEEDKIVKLSNIRKIIAKNMMNSLQTTAQLTLNASFDATSIMEYRKLVKSGSDEFGLGNITLNDMVMYAVSRTVGDFENLNAHMIGQDQIKIFSNVHLGFACDTDKGLMVPTIFDSNKMSLNDISKHSKKLAEQCKKGNIDPKKLQGASFTISNLGSFGIENFTPVINPPQTGILGVGTIEYKVKRESGTFIEYPAMFISLTFDHRAIDGAPAARFLKALKFNLENFNLLLAK
ncbi:2-oxo acid dehydrogenase subunit E2 [Alkalibaculum bacchi]|uniref:2-oxo acid dehydrogenase subunit E2 n=1 Tax=Alkalibaculum bacchi TaxID=645887 RepID=UPI0026EB310C|nr:2-oxo acid dehydrogenase subunit E2 [Alkalibaculum bacchi]